MKRTAVLIAVAGVVLLLIALFIGYSQASTRDRVIITHALTEWSLARQARGRSYWQPSEH